MLKAIGLTLLGLVLVVLAIAASRPDTFRIERTLAMKAPPERVFAQVNDFKAWREWSPWERMDPAMKRTFGAATAGPGASYAWEGNSKVGRGRMEIAEANPGSNVRIKLEFQEPMEAHNVAEFTFKPLGDRTVVRWEMSGVQTYPGKLIGLFMDMDRMVGRDFEAGLENLRAIVEK
jgi:uncharacterized protein YndB with AHSA1/START domain